MKNQFDIAIAGGGLSGLAASILLAKKGYSVILFEKNKYPFHRVCGEYISLESWDFLISLGLELKEMNLPLIKQFNLTTSSKKLNVKLPLGGFGISRFTLDFELMKLAKSSGVKVFDGTKVHSIKFEENEDQFHIESTKGAFVSKVVIGAYGKRSNLDKNLSRRFVAKAKPISNNYVGIKYHVEANLLDDLIELHIFKNGYCGISKVDQNRYCLCYLTSASNLANHNNNIDQMEQQVLYQNPQLAAYLTQFKKLYDQPLAISQIAFGNKERVKNHVLFAGDAAGMITPLTGNGMSIALHSSKILATEIDVFLKGIASRQEFELNYDIAWKNAFGQRIWAGRTFHKLFYNKFNVNLAITLLKPFPILAKKLIQLTHGKPF